MILKRNERCFLPENFSLNNWGNIKPFYQDLDQRKINSSIDFSKWLKDKSELDAYISENLAWRYIKMTIDTSNKRHLDSYQYFVSKIQPEIMPFDNRLNVKLSNSPYVSELGLSKEYEIYFRAVQTQLQLYKEENIPIIPVKIKSLLLPFKSIIVKMPAPLITGIANKNENLAASLGKKPRIRAMLIVIPLLETPGIIAIAWAQPIKKAV